MPANLTPQYRDAEKRYRQARTPEEKLEALREMLATIPKHKGTEKLQADIKRRMAALKEEKKKGPAGARQQPHWVIDKVGAGQVPVIGPPNAGKSSLIAALTSAEVRVAEYPYATQTPIPAMMPFENIQIQLIDTPPYAPDYSVDWIPELVRRADACILLVDLADPESGGIVDHILETLERRDVVLTGRIPDEREGFEVYIPTVLVGNKLESDRARATLDALRSSFGERFPVLGISVRNESGLEEFQRTVFDVMEIARVFTKAPGRDADLDEPFILPRGSTVQDLAGRIHKDFLASLRYAKLWGSSGKFQGQRVGEDHVLEDGDIVELHTR